MVLTINVSLKYSKKLKEKYKI